MKKVFFAFVAAGVLVLSACNNKPSGENATTTVDTSKPAATTPAPAATDTSKAMSADTSNAATGSAGSTGK